MRSLGIGLGAVLLAACATSPAAKPTALSPVLAPETTPAAPGGAQAAVDDQVLLPPRVNPSAMLFGYVRGAELRQSAPYRALVANIGQFPPAQQALDDLRKRCGFDPFEKLRWLTFSGTIPAELGSHAAIIVLEADVGEDELFRCAQALTENEHFKPTTIAGKRALAHQKLGLVVDGSRVWLAERPTLEAALSGNAKREPLPLSKATSFYLAGEVPQQRELQRASLTLTGTGEEMVLSLVGEARSANEAQQLLKQAEHVRRNFDVLLTLAPEAKYWANVALENTKLSQQGSSVKAELRLPSDQAAAFTQGLVSGLILGAGRRYELLSKTAEARMTLFQIAKGLSMRVVDQDLARFGASAPRTPQQTPGVSAVLVPARAWQQPAWRDIGFSLTERQYYSYEYEVAKDGKSVVARAIGDLDGDGVEARFELTVTITEPGLPYISPELSEFNPDE